METLRHFSGPAERVTGTVSQVSRVKGKHLRENNSIERLLCHEIRSDWRCNFKISIFFSFNFEPYHIATTN